MPENHSVVLFFHQGGLKGIVLVDAIQMLFVLSSILGIVIKGTIDVGGLSNVWQSAVAGKRIVFNE